MAEIIDDDVVIVSGSGLGNVIDGKYEACSFGGHPHRNSRWYAVRSFFCFFVRTIRQTTNEHVGFQIIRLLLSREWSCTVSKSLFESFRSAMERILGYQG